MSRYTATRFQKGVTNVSRAHPLANVPASDQTRAHFYQNDFDAYASADWANTTVGTGTYALTAGDGGILLLTTTAGATDSNYSTKTPAGFSYTAGQRSWARASLQANDLLSTIFFGLTAVGGGSAYVPADGMYIKSAPTTGLLTGYWAVGGVTTSVSLAKNVVAATAVVLGIEYNGIDTIRFFVNDAQVASLAAGALPAVNTGPTFGILNGAAAAKTLRVDFAQAAKERTFLDAVL